MSEEKKIKCLLVGCGNIGKRHVAVIDAIPNLEIVAVCDIDNKKITSLKSEYEYFSIYSDFETMLNSEKANLVCIATPHYMHKDMSILSLNSGYDVLVEKPMALNVNDCEKMNDAATRNKKNLWVIKQNRYNVPVKLANNAIKDGRLGKIFSIKCDILWNRYQGYYDDSDWRGSLLKEGGALFTQASHFIDLLIWWCGDIVQAKTFMETQNHNIETEDSGITSLKFASGTMGSLIWTTCVYNKNYEGSITIIGEKGTIKIGGKYLNKIEFWDVEGFPLDENIEYLDKPNSYGLYQGTSSNHDKVYSSLVDYYKGNEYSIVDGFSGMKTIRAIEQIYKARS